MPPSIPATSRNQRSKNCMWRASSTCWVVRKASSCSSSYAITRPENWVVTRSSPTKNELSPQRCSSFSSSDSSAHCSLSRSRSIACDCHCWRSHSS